MRKATLLICVLVFALPALAEQSTNRRPRVSAAYGNRDIITLRNGKEFSGVILCEQDGSIGFLVAPRSGKVHRVDVQLDRVRKINRLKPGARKSVRAALEAKHVEQRKALPAKALPRETIFFWRAPGYSRGIFSGPSPYACDSHRHIATGYGRLKHIHFLTPSGIYLMQNAKWPDGSLRYNLVELHFLTFRPISP